MTSQADNSKISEPPKQDLAPPFRKKIYANVNHRISFPFKNTSSHISPPRLNVF